MPLKRHSPAPSTSPSAARPAAATLPADWVSQQLALSGESAAVLFRGLESMRRIQAQALQQASERHAAAAGKLRSGLPAEMLTAEAALLQQDLRDAAQCWQQLSGAALEMNAELWGRATQLVNTEDAFAAATRFFHA